MISHGQHGFRPVAGSICFAFQAFQRTEPADGMEMKWRQPKGATIDTSLSCSERSQQAIAPDTLATVAPQSHRMGDRNQQHHLQQRVTRVFGCMMHQSKRVGAS